MEGISWKTLLVFGALAVGGTSSLPLKSLTYEEVLGIYIKAGQQKIYRLLIVDLQPEGEIEQCASYYFIEEKPLVVVVLICETMEKEQEEAEVDNKEKQMEEENEEEEKDQPKHLKRFKKFFRIVKNSVKMIVGILVMRPRVIGGPAPL